MRILITTWYLQTLPTNVHRISLLFLLLYLVFFVFFHFFILYVIIYTGRKWYVLKKIVVVVSRKRNYFTICVGRALMVIQITWTSGRNYYPSLFSLTFCLHIIFNTNVFIISSLYPLFIVFVSKYLCNLIVTTTDMSELKVYKVVVTIRLYEYMNRNAINKG